MSGESFLQDVFPSKQCRSPTHSSQACPISGRTTPKRSASEGPILVGRPAIEEEPWNETPIGTLASGSWVA